MKSKNQKNLEVNIAVGNAIREFRKQRGLTMFELGELSGFGVIKIHRIERSITRLTPDVLMRISIPLGITPGEILDTALIPIYKEKSE